MVNFLAREYRDDGGKTWHLGCLECLECMERAGHSKRMEHSIRHPAEIFCAKRKNLTKSVLFAILIIDARDITFFNGGAGHDKRGALYIIMYTRGAGQSNRQNAQKVNPFLCKV